MPFFLVDDGFHSHPKVVGIPRGTKRERAAGLWALAGSWSAHYLTEGFIPRHQIAELGSTHAVAGTLVEASLWTVVEGGYQFYDWTGNGNPSRAEVEARRAARKAAGQKGGKASAAARSTTKAQASASADGEALASIVVQPQAMPNQTKPKNPPTPSVSTPPPSRGTRIPDDFTPTSDLIGWARANCPDVPASEHERFMDHWRSASGAKGVKRDWPATWRNWMRRTQDDITAGRRPGARRTSTADTRVAQAQELIEWAAELDAADPNVRAITSAPSAAIGG